MSKKNKRNFQYGKTSKRKQSKNQLANLTPGWNRKPKPSPPSKFSDAGTSMVNDGMYSRKNPSAAVRTTGDKLQDKVVASFARINSARAVKKSRTQEELIMLVQFVLRYIQKCRSSLTEAVTEAAFIFRWDHQDVFRVVKDFFDNENRKAPQVKVLSKRGRGAELFKQRYADTFCVLKIEHMKEILRYIRLANNERGGMVTCGRIQAHLITKYGILFEK